MATQWTLPQGDLFEPSPPVSQLMETERRKALDLLQALLAEAMNLAPETAIKSRAEARDDEDHRLIILRAAQSSTSGNRLPSKSPTIWRASVDNTALPTERDLLGWEDVEVIDDDLGRSAGGVRRPGFERLLAAICEGRVGAVMSVEASRLARNGRDWHTLLEFCGLVGTIIVDEDGVYDPASPNDRLLLGMKGTMSEMELSVFRQRSIEAMKQKARRGELFLTVAVGYVKTGRDLIEKDPDRRVQEAIGLVFRRYAELQINPAGARVVQAGEDSVASLDGWRGGRADRLESAGILDRASYSDQPGLRRSLRLRASNDARRHREWAKARPAEYAARLEKLERFDPRSP